MNVVLLMFDQSQQWLSKAKVQSVLCSCEGTSASLKTVLARGWECRLGETGKRNVLGGDL